MVKKTNEQQSPSEIAAALRTGSQIELAPPPQVIDLTPSNSAEGQAPEATEETGEPTTPEAEAPSAEGEGEDTQDDAPADEPEADEAEESDDESDEDQDDLPDWAKKEIAKLRKDAGSRRTQLREAQSELKEAKIKIATLEREGLRTKIASKHRLPEKLAKRLSGSTEAELEADALELKSLVAPADDDDLDGGLTPGTPKDIDPHALAKAIRQGRRR